MKITTKITRKRTKITFSSISFGIWSIVWALLPETPISLHRTDQRIVRVSRFCHPFVWFSISIPFVFEYYPVVSLEVRCKNPNSVHRHCFGAKHSARIRVRLKAIVDLLRFAYKANNYNIFLKWTVHSTNVIKWIRLLCNRISANNFECHTVVVFDWTCDRFDGIPVVWYVNVINHRDDSSV